MSTYKSIHTGERVDNAVTKIPEGLPTEDSLIVVKANGSASGYVPQSQISSNKLDKQTAQTDSDQIYGKLADGSQTMFDVTMGATATTIPRRDTAGRIQVADGVSGNDAVNFNQLSAVESSVVNSLDKEHIAYVNKENTFTEQQRLITAYDPDINTEEEGYIYAGAINVSRTKYTDNTKKYYTDNDAALNARYLQLKQQIKNESGLTQHIIQLDHDGIKQVDYDNNSNTNYGYILPKTYPNKNVTLATIEDLTAQFGALNIENGTGSKAIQQVIDSNFTLVNINSDRTGQTIQSGAVGVFAAAFGGKSRSEGKRALSAGTQTIAIGNYSAAFGNNSISEGVNSFVEGSQNISRGNSSHAENANNLAAADNTHVEGVENTATHMGAHVQGYKNGSFGDYTHTEGGENVSSTTANVTYSHIGGYKNTMVITGTANPDASEGGSTPGGGESTSKPTEFWATFIDGAWNKASGTNSFTIGYWNQNYGNGTFIAGHNNIIYNNVETAMLFGRQLQCGRNCQVVFGENNLLNKDALLIVGNGTGVTGPNRFSNAFEVLKDGRAKVQTAPVDTDDVVRKLELDNVNARYVSTSILGG